MPIQATIVNRPLSILISSGLLLGVASAQSPAAETAEKDIALDDHAVHLIVHGLLHLAGHDHVDSDAKAEAMEKMEIAALAQMGLADPYGDRSI